MFLTVKGNLSLALGNDPVPREALQATLDQKTNRDREQRVFLRADGSVAYYDADGVPVERPFGSVRWKEESPDRAESELLPVVTTAAASST